MATAKFGNIIVDMRGKINGNVYSKNKSGNYVRTRVKPSNPKSSAQMEVRESFTELSQAWRALSATERQSWLTGVENFKRINRVADAINLSGNSLFVSLNKNLADVGVAQIDVCPAPAEVAAISVSTAVADNSSQSLVITLGAAVPANTAVKVFASATVSAGVNSIGSKLRQIAVADAAAGPGLTLTSDYLAKFGNIGAAGSKIFYKLVPVNKTTGQAGAEVSGSTIIVA
jgi:hypothetical protein